MSRAAVVFRDATESDLIEIVVLVAQIEGRPASKPPVDVAEAVPSAEHVRAFEEISRDEHTDLIVGTIDNVIVAMLQVTYIAGLSLRGATRALIEDVRVASTLRGQGIGRALMEYASQRATARGCKLIQLTTNVWREDAIRFYKSLGMEQTHVGLRMRL